MKIAFHFLLFLHAAIHLLGFVKGLDLRDVPALTLPVSRIGGILWLFSFLGFAIYGILSLRGVAFSWVFGLFAVLLSQALIIGAWPDAKFGTLANVLILVVALAGAGRYFFDKRWEASLDAASPTSDAKSAEVIHASELESLPSPVHKWLERSGVVGREPQRFGCIVQSARMRMKPDQTKWYPAMAVQYTQLQQPAFVWRVDLTMNTLMSLQGRDRYLDGKGDMFIALHALIPLVRADGPKIDEGAAQRFLGEMVWFPSFALSPYVRWEPIDSQLARAVMRYKGTTAEGTFYFSEKGDFVRFEALRFKDNTPDAKRYPWILEVQEYATFDGIRVPFRMTATWKLDEGDWTWLELEIRSLEYNYEAWPSP